MLNPIYTSLLPSYLTLLKLKDEHLKSGSIN